MLNNTPGKTRVPVGLIAGFILIEWDLGASRIEPPAFEGANTKIDFGIFDATSECIARLSRTIITNADLRGCSKAGFCKNLNHPAYRAGPIQAAESARYNFNPLNLGKRKIFKCRRTGSGRPQPQTINQHDGMPPLSAANRHRNRLPHTRAGHVHATLHLEQFSQRLLTATCNIFGRNHRDILVDHRALFGDARRRDNNFVGHCDLQR